MTVIAGTTVEIDNKVKFPRAENVEYFGRWIDAMARIGSHPDAPKPEQMATGDYGHAACLATDGKAKAGKNGIITLTWYDGTRCRVVVGYVGEDGILPDTWYCVRGGKIVAA